MRQVQKKKQRARIIHIEMKIHGKYRDLTLVCNILKIVASVIISSMVNMPGSFDTKLSCTYTTAHNLQRHLFICSSNGVYCVQCLSKNMSTCNLIKFVGHWTWSEWDRKRRALME